MKLYYLKIILFGASIWICMTLQAQNHPVYVDSSTDQNGFLNELSTEDFNKSTIGVLVDGVFVKSLIGVNMDSLRTFNVVSDGPLTIKGIKTENDSIVVTQKDFHKNPVRINGVDYTRFACTSFGKKVELFSLDDIRKTYFPQMGNTPCMYMVNKFFLMNDLSSYKFDKDFILKVELLNRRISRSSNMLRCSISSGFLRKPGRI